MLESLRRQISGFIKKEKKPLLQKLFRDRQRVEVVFQLLTFFLIFTVLNQTARIPGVGLDNSWRSLLAYATLNSIDFGENLAFTYGPAWYFYTKLYLPGLYYKLFLGNIFIAVVTTVVIFHRPGRIINLFVLVTIYVLNYSAFMHLLILIVCFDLIKTFDMSVKSVVLITFLALMSLAKFSFFVLIFPLLILLQINHFIKDRKKTILPVFVVFVLFTWVLFGQNILDITYYFQNSIAISSGYSRAMGLEEWNPDLISNQITILLIFALGYLAEFLYQNVRNAENWKKYMLDLSLLAGIIWYSFVVYKLGYVRSHYSVFLIYAGSLFFLVFNVKDCTRYFRAFTILTLVLTISNYNSFGKVFTGGGLKSYIFSLNFNMFEIEEDLSTRFRNVRAEILQDSFIPIDSTETVDAYPWDFTELIYSGFKLYNRPVPQSYAAYTPYLQGLNYEHLKARGPEYLLFQLKTIDNRFRTLMYGPSMSLLYTHYDINDFYVSQGKPGLVLKRRIEPRKRSDSPQVIIPNCKLGEWVRLPEQTSKFREVRMHIQPSLGGRVNSFLGREGITSIQLKDMNGDPLKRYRMIPSVMGNSFLFSPLIANTEDFIGPVDPVKRISEFRILTEEVDHFEGEFDLEIIDFDLDDSEEINPELGLEILKEIIRGDEDYLRYTKYRSDPVFELRPHIKRNIRLGNIEVVDSDPDKISFTSDNNDPIIYLPDFNDLQQEELYFRVDLEVPAKTTLQLFYTTTKDGKFNEKNSVSLILERGRNLEYFSVKSSHYINRVRLDPGSAKGIYTVHDIQVWSAD